MFRADFGLARFYDYTTRFINYKLFRPNIVSLYKFVQTRVPLGRIFNLDFFISDKYHFVSYASNGDCENHWRVWQDRYGNRNSSMRRRKLSPPVISSYGAHTGVSHVAWVFFIRTQSLNCMDDEPVERQKRTLKLCGMDASEMDSRPNVRQIYTHLDLPAVVGECELRRSEIIVTSLSFIVANC